MRKDDITNLSNEPINELVRYTLWNRKKVQRDIPFTYNQHYRDC